MVAHKSKSLFSIGSRVKRQEMEKKREGSCLGAFESLKGWKAKKEEETSTKPGSKLIGSS